MNDAPAWQFHRGDRPRDNCVELVICEACEHHRHGGKAPIVEATNTGPCGCLCHMHSEMQELKGLDR